VRNTAPVRRGMVTLLLAALLSAAGLLLASPAQACSCAEATTAQHVDDADAVFTGTVLSREVDHPDWPVMSSDDPALYVFAVDTVYKGDVHAKQGVVSAAEGASCGLDLAGDGPFVVFASSDTSLPDGQYRAGLCNGTGLADTAVVAELEGLAPAPPAAAPPRNRQAGLQSPGSGAMPAVLLGGGAAAVVLLAGWVILRRQRRLRLP
jgi:hypothetical protein